MLLGESSARAPGSEVRDRLTVIDEQEKVVLKTKHAERLALLTPLRDPMRVLVALVREVGHAHRPQAFKVHNLDTFGTDDGEFASEKAEREDLFNPKR